MLESHSSVLKTRILA